LPRPRTLRAIIGAETGGPSGRRAGEKGHSVAHYEAFVEFVQDMLRIHPDDRVTPAAALHSPFLGEELWPRPRKSGPAGGGDRDDARAERKASATSGRRYSSSETGGRGASEIAK
jgi:dual specificity tyrosine-phosphorylation-regulated kinase 1